MEARFDRIDDKLDRLTEQLQTLTVAHEHRLSKLETVQKGVVALSTALMTAVVAGLAKLMHLPS